VAELPEVLAVVTEHQGHARTCPCCGHVTRGTIPAAVLAHAFGPNLTATLAFLSGCCHDGKRTVEEIAETVFGVPLSLGSVANAEQEIAAALEEPYHEAQQAVQEAPVKNADETGRAVGREALLAVAGGHEPCGVFQDLRGTRALRRCGSSWAATSKACRPPTAGGPMQSSTWPGGNCAGHT
jgi:hypothetical protein